MVAFSKLFIKEALEYQMNLKKEICDIDSRKTKKLRTMGRVGKFLKSGSTHGTYHRFKMTEYLRISSANISSIEKVNHKPWKCIHSNAGLFEIKFILLISWDKKSKSFNPEKHKISEIAEIRLR